MFEIPEVSDCLFPIIISIPLQLQACHSVIREGDNVDVPRNLAKYVRYSRAMV